MTSPKLNKRLRGSALSLQTYKFTVLHKPGKENDEDGLSRQSWDDYNDSEGEDEDGSDNMFEVMNVLAPLLEKPSPFGGGAELARGDVGPE